MPVAERAAVVERVSWRDFLADHWRYRQGQHVTAIGPNGRGKSTVMLELLPHDLYPVVFRTKKYDTTLDRYTRGFEVMERWEAYDPDVSNRIVLWPKLRKGLRSMDEVREVYREALELIFRQGGWLPYLDELRFITDYLKLKRDVELLLLQGRSLGTGVWSGVQRPRNVPLEAYDQAGHIFMWETADLSMQDRLSELGGGVIDPDLIEAGLSDLNFHEFLHLDTARGTIVKTEVDK